MAVLVLTEFVRGRIFDRDRPGTTIEGCTADEFEQELNRRSPRRILDGYAPFCKIRLYPNWTRTRAGTIPITPENEAALRSGYEARTPQELPVLTRWFEGIEAPIASHLLVIVYDREQLAREGESIDGDWGVVGVLAQMTEEEPPMAPITVMRNALGVDEGGSGVALDRTEYMRAVAFWSRHANVKGPSS
jgi:hypothetical protein